MNHRKMHSICMAVVALALVLAGSSSTANASAPHGCWEDDCSMGDYFGDYSDYGTEQPTSAEDALFGGWAPVNGTYGYMVDPGSSGNSQDDLFMTYEGGTAGCMSTNDHPVRVVYGSALWRREVVQQAKWCWAGGHITSLRTHTTAFGAPFYGKSLCHVSDGPYHWLENGGPGHWFADVHSYATFGCDYTRTLYDTPNLVVTYMGGEPGCGGCYGWVKWDG